MVSVVIPTFNRGGLLPRAVASVLEQSHHHLECIVVDDGSDDHTPHLLERLAGTDARLQCLRLVTNRGVAAARNAGIARSRGACIALLDSDDCWLPRKLERQLAFMQEQGLEVCQTEELWLRDGRRVNPGQRYVKTGGRFFARALEVCLVSPSCCMFTRRFWDEVGPFDENLRACEDYDLWLRALLRHDIGLLPEPLVIRHGGRPDQLSLQVLGQDLFRVRALLKLLEREPLAPDQRSQVLEALRNKAQVYVQGCIRRGRLDEAHRVQSMVAAALGREDTAPC